MNPLPYSFCSEATGERFGRWSKMSGPCAVIFDDEFDPYTGACVPETCECPYGEYFLIWTEYNGNCEDSDTVKVTLFQHPVADAGADFEVACDALCFSMAALPFTYCSPDIEPPAREGRWSKAGGPCLVTFTPETAYNASVCIHDTCECPYGIYTMVWTETNGNCFDTDTVEVAVYEPPTATAEEDFSICYYEGCFTIEAFSFVYCNDELLDARNNYWELFSGPADGSFINGGEPVAEFCPDWQSTDCVWGDYFFVWHEVNGNCEATDTLKVHLFEPPTANAGVDFEADCDALCFTMQAMPFSFCSDDLGLGERFGKWTKTNGPCAVVFDDEFDPGTGVCIEECDCPWGEYTMVWTEYNGDCADGDTVIVTVFEHPDAEAGEDEWYCLGAEFSMELWHSFAPLPHEYCQETGLDAYGYWSKSCGPGLVEFTDESDPFTAVHVDAFGCYCFIWHEVNGNCEDEDTVNVCWYEHPELTIDKTLDSICGATWCYDLGGLGVEAYTYLPPPNVNYGATHWELVIGP